jgi:hypothetical protein
MIERSCPLCQSDHTAPLFKKQDTDFWRCATCRFRFATPVENPNLAQSLEAYEEAYLQYLAPGAADTANFESLWRWMESHGALPGKRLLDVGAGSGKLVRYLRARGIEACGIEPARPLFDQFLLGDDAFACATLEGRRSRACTPFTRGHSTSSPPSMSSSTWTILAGSFVGFRARSHRQVCSLLRLQTSKACRRGCSAAAGTSITPITCRTSRRGPWRRPPPLIACG